MLSWKNHAHYLCFIRNWPLIASCRCRDFPFSLLKAAHEPLGFGSIVFCKVLDLNRQFNSMTGYEIPCYSFDILDPAFFCFRFWRERYNRFWLDAFIELFQRMRILVKQPVTKGGSRIHGCLKEMKICIVIHDRTARPLTVQTDATTPNIVAPIMLRVSVVWKRMQQLLTKTTRNNMQQAVQTDATCNTQQCCVRLHRALLKM